MAHSSSSGVGPAACAMLGPLLATKTVPLLSGQCALPPCTHHAIADLTKPRPPFQRLPSVALHTVRMVHANAREHCPRCK